MDNSVIGQLELVFIIVIGMAIFWWVVVLCEVIRVVIHIAAFIVVTGVCYFLLILFVNDVAGYVARIPE